MAEICSHTITKNSAEFIESVLRQILPYTTRSIVSVDVDSKDDTKEILLRLKREFPHLEILEYKVKNYLIDLVKERNRQIGLTTEDIIWIVDDDEYYFENEICDIFNKIEKTNNDSYSVKFWFLTDKYHYNPARGKRTLRIFKNDGRKWRGEFGNEFIPTKTCEHLNNYYIHLSYVKSYSWRNEFGKKQYTKQAPIAELPKEICQKLEPFWEQRCPKQPKQFGSGN